MNNAQIFNFSIFEAEFTFYPFCTITTNKQLKFARVSILFQIDLYRKTLFKGILQ